MAGIASACPVCFGDSEAQMARGANNGVLFLLGIVIVVQVGFVTLFWSIRRRTQRHAETRSRFELIEGGAR